MPAGTGEDARSREQYAGGGTKALSLLLVSTINWLWGVAQALASFFLK